MVYIVSKKYNKKLNSKANSKKGEVHKTDIIKRYQSTEQVKTTAIFTSTFSEGRAWQRSRYLS